MSVCLLFFFLIVLRPPTSTRTDPLLPYTTLVRAGLDAPIRSRNTLPIRNIPVGSTIHCIEMLPGKGAQMARSAGASAVLLAREGTYAQVRLRSGEVRRVHIDCRATIGEVGNEENSLRQIGKAGAIDRKSIV